VYGTVSGTREDQILAKSREDQLGLTMVVEERDVMLVNCENVTPCVEVRDERRLLDILYMNSFHFYT
jgi:hypothetical protein